MGTSAGANPVTGKHPLIPSWIPDELPSGNQDFDHNADAVRQSVAPPLTTARRSASAAIRLISTGGGSPGGGGQGRGSARRARTPQGQVANAVGQYVLARGGSAGVSRRLGLATDIGARLFDALDRIARDGFDTALDALGIDLNEHSAGAVADALMTLVCDGAAGDIAGVLDENMARCACNETFISLLQQGVSLTALTAADVPAVIQSFAANAACLLITRDIFTSAVNSPRTEEEVRTLETTLKAVVETSMRLELPAGGPGTYTIRDVRGAIDRSYRDAFQILQAGN
jgi:hypothetical protein